MRLALSRVGLCVRCFCCWFSFLSPPPPPGGCVGRSAFFCPPPPPPGLYFSLYAWNVNMHCPRWSRNCSSPAWNVLLINTYSQTPLLLKVILAYRKKAITFAIAIYTFWYQVGWIKDVIKFRVLTAKLLAFDMTTALLAQKIPSASSCLDGKINE